MNETIKSNTENNVPLQESEIITQIDSFFGRGKLPTDNPKWKRMLETIENEEYEIEDLRSFLEEIKAAFSKLKGIKNHNYKNLKESLSEKEAKLKEDELKILIEGIKDGEFIELGFGNSALVFMDEKYPDYCFKIIKAASIEDPKINNVEEEGYYLNQAKDICINGARSPKPYYHHMDNDKSLHILVMETFDGIRLNDLIRDKIPVPDSFDFEKAFEGLEEYIRTLNREKNIRHNDVYTRNIIVDFVNNCFRIIDFGKASHKTALEDSPTNDEVNLQKIKSAISPIFKK